MKLRKWWDTAISVTLSGCLRKNMEQLRIAIKKIKTGSGKKEKNKQNKICDVHFSPFLYSKIRFFSKCLIGRVSDFR